MHACKNVLELDRDRTVVAGGQPREFHEQGRDGPALLVGDVNGSQQCRQVSFDALPGTHDTGTMLFWMRGLRNSGLYRTVCRQPPGPDQCTIGLAETRTRLTPYVRVTWLLPYLCLLISAGVVARLLVAARR